MDFDAAKENIQPLASGRNVERLEVALNAESHHEIHEQIIEQRREFERSIESYSGDDPLEIWYDYIQWIEQSYPKSGKETALNEVISSCLAKFENDERYKQDRRMIKLFIKYVSDFVLSCRQVRMRKVRILLLFSFFRLIRSQVLTNTTNCCTIVELAQ